MANTQIELEQDKRKDYLLVRDKEKLLDLTFTNVCMVEAMIQENRFYSRAQNPDAAPKNEKDHGSSAYWFSQLFKKLNDGGRITIADCKKLVKALNSENSTHLDSRKSNDGKQGCDVMSDRVYHLLSNFSKFCNRLNEPDFTLINELACPTDKYSGRELAFASKFCHYAAFWLFKGMDAADNYSIFDSIVSGALVDYARKYGVDDTMIDKFERLCFRRVLIFPDF